MKTYIKYTQREITDKNFKPWLTLNGLYDLSYFLAYPEYQNIKIINVSDWSGVIPTYTWNYKLGIIEHTMTPEEQEEYISTIPIDFNVNVLTIEETIAFIKEETDLTETTPNTFLVRGAIDDWINWPEEAVYLLIN